MTIADRASMYLSLAKSREASALRAHLRFVNEQHAPFLAGSTAPQRTLVTCGFTKRSRRGGTESTLTPPGLASFLNGSSSIMAILFGIRRNETFEVYSSTTTTWWSLSCPHHLPPPRQRGFVRRAFRLMIRTKGIHGKVPPLVSALLHSPARVCLKHRLNRKRFWRRSSCWSLASITTDSEQLKPAFMALRARLERLGKLHELQFWVTDRCCEGGNPLERWINKVFPAMRRAPLKDRFHLVKAVLQTLNENFPQQKSDIGNELIGALIEFPEEEMAPGVKHLRSKGKERSDIQGRAFAKKTYRKDL
jgi:hypothetical protein